MALPLKEMERFTRKLFDRSEQAQKAARILKRVVEARSPGPCLGILRPTHLIAPEGLGAV